MITSALVEFMFRQYLSCLSRRNPGDFVVVRPMEMLNQSRRSFKISVDSSQDKSVSPHCGTVPYPCRCIWTQTKHLAYPLQDGSSLLSMLEIDELLCRPFPRLQSSSHLLLSRFPAREVWTLTCTFPTPSRKWSSPHVADLIRAPILFLSNGWFDWELELLPCVQPSAPARPSSFHIFFIVSPSHAICLTLATTVKSTSWTVK